MVSGGGLEPPRVASYAPQTYASASSAIPTSMVPKVGLEPTRAYAHGALNTACLPIPPLRRLVDSHSFYQRDARRSRACWLYVNN
jgi:hypothetical protein